MTRNVDLTGWCGRGYHDRCDGSLRTATGAHWYCICDCHPEPQGPTMDPGGHLLAMDVYRRARLARLSEVGGSSDRKGTSA